MRVSSTTPRYCPQFGQNSVEAGTGWLQEGQGLEFILVFKIFPKELIELVFFELSHFWEKTFALEVIIPF